MLPPPVVFCFLLFEEKSRERLCRAGEVRAWRDRGEAWIPRRWGGRAKKERSRLPKEARKKKKRRRGASDSSLPWRSVAAFRKYVPSRECIVLSRMLPSKPKGQLRADETRRESERKTEIGDRKAFVVVAAEISTLTGAERRDAHRPSAPRRPAGSSSRRRFHRRRRPARGEDGGGPGERGERRNHLFLSIQASTKKGEMFFRSEPLASSPPLSLSVFLSLSLSLVRHSLSSSSSSSSGLSQCWERANAITRSRCSSIPLMLQYR